MVLHEHTVHKYRRICRRLQRSVRIKYRRHPDDVIALPLARLSNRVDKRNSLLINASCLAVDIGLVVVGIENLQLVSGVAATGRRQKDAAIAARLIGPGDTLGDPPFNVELEIVELARSEEHTSELQSHSDL